MDAVIELDGQGPWSATSQLWPRNPTTWQAHHLLSRFANGPTEADVAVVLRDGCRAWWDNQVQLGRNRGGHAAAPDIAAAAPELAMTPLQARAEMKSRGREYGADVMDRLTSVTLGLQAWSPAQLYETVVDFFGNHLNAPNYTDGMYWTRHRYDLDVIRAHAFGRFSSMLVAAMRHPSMLVYLDGFVSKATQLNENLGRELLELHTVGVEAGYTETDVLNSARILTGLTQDAQTGLFRYRPDWHWTGTVRVLGFSHANTDAAQGESVAVAYLEYLARHPSTARRLARKLCLRYVSDTPDAALVEKVAAAYLANDTAILPMLETIASSPSFWSSRRAKTRRPTENFVATMRILGARPVGDLGLVLQNLHWMAAPMNNLPQCWVPPDGYPDVATAWRSTGALARQWSLHRTIAGNKLPTVLSVKPLVELYGSPAPLTSAEALGRLARRLLGGPLPDAATQALLAFLGEPGTTPLAQSALKVQLGQVVSLLLDGPQFARR